MSREFFATCVLCQQGVNEIVGQCLANWCLPCYAKAGGSAGVVAMSNAIEAKHKAARGVLFREEFAARGGK